MHPDAHHRFVPEECDWGFTRFHDLRKLYNAQDHQKKPIIEDDAAEVTVFVRVLKDPTGVLWHNFQKYMASPPCDPVLICSVQLRFKERNWLRWPQESRRYMLYELPPAIPFLHSLFPTRTLPALRTKMSILADVFVFILGCVSDTH